MTKTAKRASRAPARKPAKPVTRGRPHSKPVKEKPYKAKGGGEREVNGRKFHWRGVQIELHYRPDGVLRCAHLELRVIAPEGAPIPTTQTGYCSRYVHTYPVQQAGGPVAYVRELLDREARNKAYLRALHVWRQLDLFAALEA
ncbi:MAG TPA: hypothetical protein VE078_03420 [Thermoanaerobaculia bacterium]|nr:hypothetical protein [Thermoanaerobaculia bacterium]